MKIQFAFKSSYLNSIWYLVTDSSGSYEVEYRAGLSAYEKSISTRKETYEAEHAPLVGWLHRYGQPIPQETLRAFNEWRRAEAARCNAHFDAHPERYGEIAPDDPLRQVSHLAKGSVHWQPAPDWHWQTNPSAGAYEFHAIEEEKEEA